jgi:hypothetical protein
MNENVKIEIKKPIQINDGLKYLIFFLRKKNVAFNEICNLIFKLNFRFPSITTVRSIYLSINNRLKKSSVYSDSDLIFVVMDNLANLLVHQIMKLQNIGYKVAIEIKNIDTGNYRKALNYTFQVEGKHLNFRMKLIFNWEGKALLDIEEFHPIGGVKHDNPLEIIQHLSYLDKAITEVIRG